MRLFLAMLTAMLLGLGAGVVATAQPDGDGPPTGSLTIALLDGASADTDDPRAQVYITDHLAPGETVEHTVRITNDMGAEETIELYAGPATLVDGDFTVANRGEINELTGWVSLTAEELVLADGQSDEVTVTIAVPDDAPEGEQYGVIWAAAQPRDGDDAEVQVVSRVGVRMYLSVGPGGAPAAAFRVDDLQPDRDGDGDAVVRSHVTNTGGRAVDLTGQLELTAGPGGLSAQSVTAKTTTVAPGESGVVEFTVPDSAALPAGPWQAAVTVESGHLTEAVDEQITFPDEASDEAGQADGISEWVWIIIAIAIALFVAGIGWAWPRRGGHTGDRSA